MSCRPDHKTIIPLYIPQGIVRDLPFISYDVDFDELGAEEARARSDMTGAVVYFRVEDADGVTVIDLNSLLASQIEIGADQSLGQPAGTDTRGVATVKLVTALTSSLTPGAIYWYDVWAEYGDGRVDTIVDKSRFNVCDGIFEPTVGPPAAVPGTPASQTDQHRSFLHTWSADGDSDTVAIPGNGMVDAEYCVAPTINTLPSGGAAALLIVPETTRTSTQFVILASGSMKAGTTIDIIVRDRA